MTETITIRLEDAYPRPGARATDEALVAEIAGAIAAVGYDEDQAIVVRPAGNRYIIIDGQHRAAAALAAGLTEIPAHVREVDDGDALTREGVLNLQRPDTAEERYARLQDFLDLGDAGIPVDPERVQVATGVTADQQVIAVRVRGRIKDPVALRDQGSIDRILALDEFADDDDAVHEILNADERSWPSVVRDLRMKKRTAAALAEKEAIVAAAGVECLDEYPIGRIGLGRGDEVPEGAEAARITTPYWNGTAEITWYGPVGDTALTPEQVAEAEAREAASEAMSAAHAARISFLAATLSRDIAALKGVAEAAWKQQGAFKSKDGYSGFGGLTARYASVARDEAMSEVSGLATQMVASVLVEVERQVAFVLGHGSGLNEYMAGTHGKGAKAYLDALVAAGYEPSETEAARIADLEAALKPKRRAKKVVAE